MKSREYFRQIAEEGNRLRHLNALIKEIDGELGKLTDEGAVGNTGLVSGESYRSAIALKQGYESERKTLLSRRHEAEEILGRVPMANGAQIIRRRYLFGWPMDRAAREAGYSERGTHYIQAAAFKWIDEQ